MSPSKKKKGGIYKGKGKAREEKYGKGGGDAQLTLTSHGNMMKNKRREK